jgi:hypothetical protein
MLEFDGIDVFVTSNSVARAKASTTEEPDG